MVGGGCGKFGEIIRFVVRCVELEWRLDIEYGIVIIYYCLMEGLNVRVKIERVMIVFVMFMDVLVWFLFCILDKCKIFELLFGYWIKVMGYIF